MGVCKDVHIYYLYVCVRICACMHVYYMCLYTLAPRQDGPKTGAKTLEQLGQILLEDYLS